MIHPRWHTLRDPRLASFRHALRIGLVPPLSITASPAPLAFRGATHELASFRHFRNALCSGPGPWLPAPGLRLASFRHSLRIGFASPTSIPAASAALDLPQATPKLASFRHYPCPALPLASHPSPHPPTTAEYLHTCLDSPRFASLAARLLSFHRSLHPGPRVRHFTHAPICKGRHP